MTARIDGPSGIIAPAVMDPEWLPPASENPWLELAEMRVTHRRLRAASHDAAGEVRVATQRLAGLASDRHDALKESYRAGEAPDIEGQERERKRLEGELASAKERSTAATSALVDFINETVERIAARRAKWLGDLDGIEAQRRAEVESAKRALKEAEGKLGTTRRLRHWVDRTGGTAATLAMEHIPYSQVPVPAPQPNSLSTVNGERDAWTEAEMRKQLLQTPANQPPPAGQDKEAMFDQMIADIERQERNEAEKGVRNAA